MAEPEDVEEDLFADLYEGDDFSKPAAKPSTTEEKEPINAVESPVQPAAHDEMQQDQDEERPDGANAATDHQVPSWEQENGHELQELEAEHEDRITSIKEDGKMFIGGLNWETTDQSLKEYFSQFGEVIECTVMRDGLSGRSRGFGFLTFKDPKTVNTVMVKEHYLDGKIIDPKRAIPRDEQERTSKIFVGGVSQDATEEIFKQYFMKFGRVIDATLMIDKDTGRPRGFGFVTFDSEAAVDAALDSDLMILGKPIEVKKAQPRGNIRDGDDNMGDRRRHERGGRHGDRYEQQSRANEGHGGNNGNNGNVRDQNQPGNGNTIGGMTPQVLAQNWQRMQQYMVMMQQMMASRAMGGGGGPAQMGGMNPAMMQQMQQYQQMQAMAQAGQNGAQTPQAMNQAMQQQQQQQQQLQLQQQQQQQQQQQMQAAQAAAVASPPNFSSAIPTGPSGGGGASPGFSAYEQQLFEQQKYEQQQARRTGRDQSQYQQFAGAGGGPTSWEGMYDDVPQPQQQQQNVASRGGQGRQGTPNGPRGGRGGGGGGGGGGADKASFGGPQSAPPANAPTGPKNPGRSGGGGYRGGGRMGGRGQYHPYQKH